MGTGTLSQDLPCWGQVRLRGPQWNPGCALQVTPEPRLNMVKGTGGQGSWPEGGAGPEPPAASSLSGKLPKQLALATRQGPAGHLLFVDLSPERPAPPLCPRASRPVPRMGDGPGGWTGVATRPPCPGLGPLACMVGAGFQPVFALLSRSGEKEGSLQTPSSLPRPAEWGLEDAPPWPRWVGTGRQHLGTGPPSACWERLASPGLYLEACLFPHKDDAAFTPALLNSATLPSRVGRERRREGPPAVRRGLGTCQAFPPEPPSLVSQQERNKEMSVQLSGRLNSHLGKQISDKYNQDLRPKSQAAQMVPGGAHLGGARLHGGPGLCEAAGSTRSRTPLGFPGRWAQVGGMESGPRGLFGRSTASGLMQVSPGTSSSLLAPGGPATWPGGGQGLRGARGQPPCPRRCPGTHGPPTT